MEPNTINSEKRNREKGTVRTVGGLLESLYIIFKKKNTVKLTSKQ